MLNIEPVKTRNHRESSDLRHRLFFISQCKNVTQQLIDSEKSNKLENAKSGNNQDKD